MAASGLPCQVNPTGRRLSKTVPNGCPAPILASIRCNPNGVWFDPDCWPVPNRDVDTTYRRRKRASGRPAAAGIAPVNPASVQGSPARGRITSNSDSCCFETLTINTNRVSVICRRRQVEVNERGRRGINAGAERNHGDGIVTLPGSDWRGLFFRFVRVRASMRVERSPPVTRRSEASRGCFLKVFSPAPSTDVRSVHASPSVQLASHRLCPRRSRLWIGNR